jgi:transcriptional regulator with XRE-family HTH domain
MVSEMNACQAVQQLRIVSGLSQQAFAGQLGMSVRAIANYEKDRTPNKRASFRLAKLAMDLDRVDLAMAIAGPLETKRHGEEGVIGEVEHSAILTLAQNRGSEWLLRLLAREVESLMKDGKKLGILWHPPVTGADAAGVQIAVMESILGDLRGQISDIEKAKGKPTSGRKKTAVRK